MGPGFLIQLKCRSSTKSEEDLAEEAAIQFGADYRGMEAG
jgi:hypothetical protein